MTIAWFHDIASDDINLVGGKGANLGKMARAGLPVPPGFCVTTEAYKKFIAEMDLWPEMAHLLATLSPREAGKRIRRDIENAKIPGAISKSIITAYISLNNGHAPVAVRSSATAEDLEDASFAGQQETYLGIRGESELTRYVQRCWASLWTERAIAYRDRNHFPHEQVSLSVVIQEMIAPEVSGVLFTVNPITNNSAEMLVNASFGLGESVVSGRVTPDTYRLARKRFQVLEQVTGSKEIRIDMANKNGTTETTVADEDRQRLTLDDISLRHLLELGNKVEAYYGKPQDIEWGLANGQVYLLQTRPITSLDVSAAKPPHISRAQHEIINDILEHYPEPPYPMDYQAVTDSYQQLVDTMQGFGISLPPANEIILIDNDGIPSIVAPKVRVTPRIFGLFSSLSKTLKTDPKQWINQQHTEFISELNSLNNIDVTQLDNHALAQFIQSAVKITSRVGAIRFRDYIIPAIARSAFLKALMGFYRDAKQVSVMDLLGSLPYKTAVIDQALHDLAVEAKKLPQASEILLNIDMDAVITTLEKNSEGRIFLEKVNTFMKEHGARTMKMYLPFSNRSWAETPATLLTTIGVLLRSDLSRSDGHDRYPELRQRILAGLPAWSRQRFISSLEQFRIGHIARESTLYAIEQGFQQARRGVDEAVRRLVAAEALPDTALSIYITLTELYAALDGSLAATKTQELVLRREKARPQALKSWRGKWQITRKSTSDADVMTGLSGSSGYAEGPAKVINGPAEFDKLQPGDVLVCPFTDPAWTPLFTLASAVVSDTGGPLSHAAIVAREYGIPAVLGTQIATSYFKDCDVISVDGQNGKVRRVR